MSTQEHERYQPQTIAFFRYLVKNPGVTVSLAYVLLTLCGISYAFTLYFKFNIPILKLADVSDLLIFGIGEPAAVIMFFGGLLLAFLFDYIYIKTDPIWRRWKDKPASMKKLFFRLTVYVPQNQANAGYTLALISMLYAFVFVSIYTKHQADSIREGDGNPVYLQTESDTNKQSRLFLGSTTNFVFTYDVDTAKAYITPIEQVISIEPITQSKEANEARDESDSQTEPSA